MRGKDATWSSPNATFVSGMKTNLFNMLGIRLCSIAIQHLQDTIQNLV